MYSCIYLCVLKRSGTRLYTDIMDHINQIYVNLNINLQLEEAELRCPDVVNTVAVVSLVFQRGGQM